MKALIGLLRHELIFFTLRPWASAWIVAFVVSSAIATFFFGNLLDSPHAQLAPFFSYLPWIGALLLPALGMQLWAREAELGTLVWLLSLPHSTLRCLLVKFTAAWLVVALSLLLSFTLPLTLLYVGEPDHGILLTSYLGSIGFLSVQLALCNLASCITHRRLSAYVLGVVFCTLHNIPGCDLLVDALPHIFSSGWFGTLSRWGSSGHLLGFLRGVIDSRDLFFWLGSVAAILGTSYITLIWKRSLSSTTWRHPEPRTLAGLSAISLLSILLLILANQWHRRWDFTQEQLFTLSEGSRAIVEKLPEPISVTFYFSRSHRELEPGLRTYGQRIDELLREYAAIGSLRFTYRIVDPLPLSTDEMDARINGLMGLNTIQGDTLYFGAVLQMGQQTLSIPYFDLQKEDQLEYELSEALVQISQKSKPILGILSSIPVIGDQGQAGPNLNQDWAFVSALRSLYQVVPISSSIAAIPSQVRTLLVLHPKELSENTEFALDQYLLKGGNLFVAVDPFCRSELLYAGANSQPSSVSSHLPRLFKAWGMEYDAQKMCGDSQRSTSMQTVMQTIDYPFYIHLGEDDLSTSHPISSRMRNLYFSEPGSLSHFATNSLHWQILAQTSADSGVIPTEMAAYMAPTQLVSQLKTDGKKRALAGVLFGRFSSAFSQAPASSPIEDFVKVGNHDNALVIFSDVDFFADQNMVEKIQSLNQMVMKPKNDNLSFLMRAIEFIGGNKDLILIRNTGRIPRPLSRLQRLNREGQERWQSQLDQVGTQLRGTEVKLKASQDADSQRILSPQQEQEMKSLRLTEAQLRAEQRRIKAHMLDSGQWLRAWLISGNILFVPLVIANLWLWSIRRRLRWYRSLTRSVRIQLHLLLAYVRTQIARARRR